MQGKVFEMRDCRYTINIYIFVIPKTFVKSVQYTEIEHFRIWSTVQGDQDELQCIIQSIGVAIEKTYKMYRRQISDENFLKIITKNYLQNKLVFNNTTENIDIFHR